MEQTVDEILRYRFTAWIKIVAKRAKIDYIRQLNRHPKEQSIYDEKVAHRLTYEQPLFENKNDTFNFENKDLVCIFSNLSRKRKQILILLFVHNLTPEEVAIKLGCSVQHVYNLRSLVLKELRNKLGDKHND